MVGQFSWLYLVNLHFCMAFPISLKMPVYPPKSCVKILISMCNSYAMLTLKGKSNVI